MRNEVSVQSAHTVIRRLHDGRHTVFDLFGNGCVGIMFLDRISAVFCLQLLFLTSPAVAGAASEGGITKASRPIIVKMDHFKTTERNIITKDNMPAFYLPSFKRSHDSVGCVLVELQENRENQCR